VSRGRRKSIEAVLENFRLDARAATLLEDEVEDAIDPNAMTIRIWHQVLLGGLLFEVFMISFLLTFQDRETTLSLGYSAFFVCEVMFLFDSTCKRILASTKEGMWSKTSAGPA
jgi:hypothetical protein